MTSAHLPESEYAARAELLLKETSGRISRDLLERVLGRVIGKVPEVIECTVIERGRRIAVKYPDGVRFLESLGYDGGELDHRLESLGFFCRGCDDLRGFHYCPRNRTFGECHRCYSNPRNYGYHTRAEGCPEITAREYATAMVEDAVENALLAAAAARERAGGVGTQGS